MYTRVLKGHIAIASAVFPAGTPGCLLDSLARIALWAAGKNFNHGIAPFPLFLLPCMHS